MLKFKDMTYLERFVIIYGFLLAIFLILILIISNSGGYYSKEVNIIGNSDIGNTDYQIKLNIYKNNDSYVPINSILPITAYTVGNMSNSSQAVITDNEFLYYTQSDSIWKYNKTTMSLITTLWHPSYYGTVVGQINGMFIKDNLLYTSCMDFFVGHTGTRNSYCKIFYLNNLTYKEEFYLTGDSWTEGIYYHNNSFWFSYGDINQISRFDNDFNLIANYPLTFPISDVNKLQSLSIDETNNIFYVANHGTSYPYYLDSYKWNGNGFDELKRYDTITDASKHTQGFTFENTSLNYGWWVERSAGNPKIWNCSIQYNSIITNNNSVVLDNNCNSTFRDIRFTNSSNYNYSYWIEELIYDYFCIVWVKIENNLTVNTTLYILYGNNDWYNQSNGDNTFSFFDNFTTYDTTYWYTLGGTPDIYAGKLRLISGEKTEMKSAFNENVGKRFISNCNVLENNSYNGIGSRSYGDSTNGIWFRYSSGTPYWQTFTQSGGVSDIIEAWTWGIMGYHNYEFLWDTEYTLINIDNILINNHTTSPLNAIGFYYTSNAPANSFYDWCFIANYTHNEPILETWSIGIEIIYIPYIDIPIAKINSILVFNYNDAILNGTYEHIYNNTIVRYSWTSSIDGEFYNNTVNPIMVYNFTIGSHIIYFKILDLNGTWSETVNTTMEIIAIPTITENNTYWYNSQEGIYFVIIPLIILSFAGIMFIMIFKKNWSG